MDQCTSSSFTLYVLALDEDTQSFFSTKLYDNVVIISLTELELSFPELNTAKGNRSKVEYYFTLSPYLPLYILETFADVDRITTMDADLFFFSDPAKIFESLPDAPVLITPHNFSKQNSDLIIWGKFNVSFQSFKKNQEAMACLRLWKDKCLEWCYDTLDLENKRFADQKYLDEWAVLFPYIQSIDLKGAGLAPWNIDNHTFTILKNKVYVDGEPLIYFHFQHLRVFNTRFALHGLKIYKSRINSAIKFIYHKYLLQLRKNTRLDKENKILRNSFDPKQLVHQKLFKTDGYFFFTNSFIVSVNFYRTLKKFLDR